MVTRALLAWYARERRRLPWREAPTPYRVLLSELMLQQTRVDTVIPYFERFVARWPTLSDLAAASEEEVLAAWAGLGYYSRARNLHRCASAATEAGGLPDTPEALRALPGIGPYTAGAIASIAFGVSTPLVDGNVERVLSRLDGRTEDPKGSGRRALWARAAELHEDLPDGAHPGDLNQALMELGATVCTPRAPRCGACPLAEPCVARAAGDPESLPTRAPRRKPTPIRGASGVLHTEQGFLLGRRPAGLLGGLWEPIGCEVAADDQPEVALRAAFADRAGLEVRIVGFLGEVVHVFTHRRLTCSVYAVEADGSPAAAGWYTAVRVVSDPGEVPLSTLARRILSLHQQPVLPLAAERG